MALNLKVNAEVVDITRDVPKAEDVFLVDTNVWYWMTYSKASQVGAQAYQVRYYPSYTNSALGVNSKIYQSGLSLAELSHIIEGSERKIFEATNPGIKAKEFRHNFAGTRQSVCLEIKAACMQVLSLSETLAITIDSAMSGAALNRVGVDHVDGYDLFMLESMSVNGVLQVITDDGDFATVAGIRVFTANRNVIAAARAQGKLVTR